MGGPQRSSSRPPAKEGEEASPYAALREGLVVASKYRLVEVRGEGAMGAVWSAMHLTLGHTVAIKFLNVSTAGSPAGRARFEREAKIAARLGEASRHITRVIDHGVLDDGMPYIVMELLQGESLATYLKRERIIPIARIARIVQHLARALHVAHSAGVVHRDLKPANIFLCQPESGEDLYVKLLDFGIAKATEGAEDERTGNALLGTPSYMSPEQLSDGVVDARADLWAVAAIVYRMAAGRPPFGGGPIGEVGMRIVSTDPAPPTQVNAELSAELDMWMARALSKKPEERFQSANELSDFLGVVAGLAPAGTASSGEMRAAVLPAKDDEPSLRESKSSTTGSGAASTIAPVAHRPKLAPVVAVLGLCAALLLAVLLRRGPSPSVTASPASSAATPTASASAIGPAASTVAVAPPVPSASNSSTASASAPAASAAAGASAAASGTSKATTATPVTKKKSPDSSGWGNKKEL